MYVFSFCTKIIVRNVHLCPIENVIEMTQFISEILYLKSLFACLKLYILLSFGKVTKMSQVGNITQ